MGIAKVQIGCQLNQLTEIVHMAPSPGKSKGHPSLPGATSPLFSFSSLQKLAHEFDDTKMREKGQDFQASRNC